MGGIKQRRPEEARFLADAMLGRLARWLRVLGWDTAYDQALHDPALVNWAVVEDRILLTRDRLLLEDLRPDRHLLIVAERPLDQLRQVVTDASLTPPVELFTRCLVCNAVLRVATEAETLTLVPSGSQAVPGPVRRCSACGRVYWLGSHARRMRAALARAFPEWPLG